MGRVLNVAVPALLAACLQTVANPLDAQQAPFPESRYFDSGDVRIHYVDEGDGEPVLLIHGFSLDLGIGWIQPGVFSELVDAGYRVVAYDGRGHGASDKPHDEASYGAPELADPIRLLDHLGIERAHVVGYSRGARIAHRLRAAHPERIRSVVMGGYGEGAGGGDGLESEVRQGLAAAMEAGDFRPLVRAVAPDMPAEQVEEWHAVLQRRNDGRALASVFRADLSLPPLEEVELRQNRVPTLAIVGEEDPFRPGVDAMADVLTGVEVLVIDGADHASTVNRPEFLTALRGFLVKHGGR